MNHAEPFYKLLNEMVERTTPTVPDRKDVLIRQLTRIYIDGDVIVRGADEGLLYGLLEQLADLAGFKWDEDKAEASQIRAEYWGKA